MPKHETSLLRAALIGYEAQIFKLRQEIAAIAEKLGNSGLAAVPGTSAATKPRRKLSAAARKRIALAQKKRWAAFHKQKAGKE